MSKDRRVCLIRKSNGGHASAINRAFTESHGDIVCILDADDIYYPAKLQKVVDAFKLNTGAGIVTHNLMIIDSADRQNRVASCHPGGYLGPEIPTLRMGLPMPQASGLSFRREVLQQILPLPEEEFRSAADWAIAYAAAYLTYTEHVAEALSGYRIHGSNLSGTTSTAARLTQTMIAKNLECMERVIAFVNRFVQGRFGISVPASRVRNVLEHRLILGILAGEGDSVQLVVDDLRGAFRTVRRDYPFHRYLFWVTLSRLPAGLARALLTLAFYGFSLQGRLKGRLQKARYYSATERVGL